MRLFDTRTSSLVRVPDGPVSLYVCGVTPYDTTHLGHAFTFVQFDALARTLRWLGREVRYVQNVTDIDDSILKRARELGTGWRELGDRELARYEADMVALGVSGPDALVRATEVIPTMHDIIAALLARDAAYVATGGSVFFRARSDPAFGELSRLSREQMLAIAADQDDADLDDPRKEDPLDPALWKGSSGAPEEPRWPSPWGEGRPGWHIECGAIVLREVGPQVTLHGGGADLVFPHHECERALMELATGRQPFAAAWLHTGMLRISGEKMSKSLRNMVFASDLVDRYGGQAVRLALLRQHYRASVEWSEAAVADAAEALERLRARAVAADQPQDASRLAVAAFRAAIEEDFDVPTAVEVLERQASGNAVRQLGGILGLELGQGGGTG